MNLSLNELEATAKKATRGAGYEWGIAEEAGMAMRWLGAHGIEAVGALVLTLKTFDGVRSAPKVPTRQGDLWTCAKGPLCPITTGAALSDGAIDLNAETARLTHVVAPILLLPFVTSIAARSQRSVRVAWDAGAGIIDGSGVQVLGDMHMANASDVVIEPIDTVIPNAGAFTRAIPQEADWRALAAFAQRTYAPATDASRQKGAGAGVNDND